MINNLTRIRKNSKIRKHYFYIFLFINREVERKIEQVEQEAIDNSAAYNSAKQKYSAVNDTYYSKHREWRSVGNKIKRLEDDINLLKREIQKLEG